jgi:hypothetical protein
LADWDNVESKYKHLVNPSDLLAGTGYSIAEYPEEIIKEAKNRLSKQDKNNNYVGYRTVTDDAEELYKDLKNSSDWFLKALRIDYGMSFRQFPEKRKMTQGVIDRILEERKNGI